MADRYFLLADFDSYMSAHEKAEALYMAPDIWNRKSLLNICHAGKFSSDRTIEEYAQEIWKLKKQS